jgi:hypothetical protein
MKATLGAGMLSAVTGLLTFLVIHHLWIMPIWFILPIGLVIAMIGGAAVGWAYDELLPHLPPRPWRALVMIGLIWLILLPGIVLAELRDPFFTVSGENARLTVGVGRVALLFIVELLITSALMGALLGWLFGRNRRTALATAVAGVTFALGPGHNIPLIGGTPGVGKELGVIAAIITVSAIVLVQGQALLQWTASPAKRGDPAPSRQIDGV